jgi:hypothetical protein
MPLARACFSGSLGKRVKGKCNGSLEAKKTGVSTSLYEPARTMRKVKERLRVSGIAEIPGNYAKF